MAEDFQDDDPSLAVPGGAEKRDTDRRCLQCDVKLSLYNPGPHCWQHTIGRPWRGPSARPSF